MSLSFFYRDQAAQQTKAADGATLANVRERAERAAQAWSDLAVRSERADRERANAAQKQSPVDARGDQAGSDPVA